MFRLDGIPQPDPIEEKKKIKRATQENVFMFFFMCAVIRISK